MISRRTSTIAEKLIGVLSPATVMRHDELMAKHTTLRVGGRADLYIEPASERDVSIIVQCCREHGAPFFLLGRGSNLIVRDGGYRGVVICLASAEFAKVAVEGHCIRAGAGAKQKAVALEAKRAGLSGVEFLDGIPGSVGGALRMNAGAMGRETFDAVEAVRVMDYSGNMLTMDRASMDVRYRCCETLKNKIALEAVFRCEPQPVAEIEARMKSFSEKRWSSQPAAPSAGCMFQNPPGIPAGKLIDELGLKGAFVGGALVSLEHGNFIVNGGDATAAEVLELIARLQSAAKIQRGIDLRTEVEIIGET